MSIVVIHDFEKNFDFSRSYRIFQPPLSADNRLLLFDTNFQIKRFGEV